MSGKSRFILAVLGSVLPLAILANTVRSGAQQYVTWPTYFRTGPGEHYSVMEELSRGQSVLVQSCDKQWCKVTVGRVPGYMKAANIAARSPPSSFPAATDPSACFTSSRAGYPGGDDLRYCPR
jgi:uncharacterized protein YgiM (DUF1202 family)